jgi:hypothetical protein
LTLFLKKKGTANETGKLTFIVLFDDVLMKWIKNSIDFGRKIAQENNNSSEIVFETFFIGVSSNFADHLISFVHFQQTEFV